MSHPHLQLLSTADESRWQAVLPAGRSVFGSVEFVRLAEKHNGFAGRLMVVQAGHHQVAYPFFIRPLHVLPFRHSSGSWDTTTPDFTGPFGLTSQVVNEFLAAKKNLFREIGAVSEFGHLHPFTIDATLLKEDGAILNRELVWVDSSLSDDDLWREHFSYACRKNIKRAQSESVSVFAASNLGDIREFHRIYCHTMDRAQALSTYYFPLDYFEYIFEHMPHSSRFVLAEHRGNIIGAILYLHDHEHVYSYLGGADYSFQQLRPSNAIVYNTIEWTRAKGKKALVLGGGYRDDDGIFRFKASFSRHRAPFYTYRHVHLPELYSELERNWCQHAGVTALPDGFFPSYRAAIPVRTPSEQVCIAS